MAVSLTGEPNPYIGDVIAAGLEEADAVVVLATPDDIVRLDPALSSDSDDPELSEAGQPRQNVIYEAGMAMALAPTRTLLVGVPGVKIFSDIAGRHLAYLDDSPWARKRIIGRLQTMGLAVDDSGEAWLDAGAFGDRALLGPTGSLNLPETEGVESVANAQAPAFLEWWRHSTDGIEASPVMQMASTSMPGIPSSADQGPFARFGICVTCDPLEPITSSSTIGSAFLDLLGSDIVTSLLAIKTGEHGDIVWTRQAGNGALRLEAIGGADRDASPRVSAMFLPPARGVRMYGQATGSPVCGFTWSSLPSRANTLSTEHYLLPIFMRVSLERSRLHVPSKRCSWNHLCVVGDQRIDPLDALGIVPARPLPFWGCPVRQADVRHLE